MYFLEKIIIGKQNMSVKMNSIHRSKTFRINFHDSLILFLHNKIINFASSDFSVTFERDCIILRRNAEHNLFFDVAVKHFQRSLFKNLFSFRIFVYFPLFSLKMITRAIVTIACRLLGLIFESLEF